MNDNDIKKSMELLKQWAEKLNGRTRQDEISHEECEELKKQGLVVVFGYSDDNAEFRGAIDDEIDCYDGGRVFEKDGKYIDAVWCDGDFTWTYNTNIPHMTFDILDDEEKYCKGIIFKASDLSKPQTNYDRIKSMDVDEMAELFYGIIRGRDLHIMRALETKGIDASLIEAAPEIHIAHHKQWLLQEVVENE